MLFKKFKFQIVKNEWKFALKLKIMLTRDKIFS
jgi:hypothetical protein